VGSGWNYVEYESLGVEFRRRGARLEEQVQLLRRLWTERVIDFTGSFHRVDRAGLLPLPGRSIPIWFGGFADAALDRCARIGDGFIFSRSSSGALPRLERLRARVTEAGRDPAALGYEEILAGEPAEWPAMVDEWRDAGGTHVAVMPSGDGAGIVDDLHRCREALAAQFD
jgi:alkanesulfonate monooxygenase SsuD/methylene tetrahydromethanopterin reductase-like flavin-dependent oxidoreductase (luciferase family)